MDYAYFNKNVHDSNDCIAVLKFSCLKFSKPKADCHGVHVFIVSVDRSPRFGIACVRDSLAGLTSLEKEGGEKERK